MDATDAALVAVLPFLTVLAILLALASTERSRMAVTKRAGAWVYLLTALGPFLTFLAMLLLVSSSSAGTTERVVALVVAGGALAVSLFAVARWFRARRQ